MPGFEALLRAQQELINAAREYAREPEVLAGIRRGMKDRRKGRIRPWAEVKRKLGL